MNLPQEILLSDIEMQGLDRMRELNEAFLGKNKCSDEVRQFLIEAGSNINLMLAYFRARKNKPEYAWETLKRNAEVRFDQHPEVFVKKPASFYEKFGEIELMGLLKNRDSHGRRVFCIQGSKWDPNELNMEEITNFILQLAEQLLSDDDAIENGVVSVVNGEGVGLHIAKYLGLNVFRRLINCLWFACPLRLKKFYFINVPIYLLFLYEIVKPFLPKKLKERFVITTSNKKFTALHSNIDKTILPKYLGGTLDYNDAFELVKF